MQKIDVKTLFENAVHFGQRVQKWNPKMKPYLHGKRAGIHIFDLNKTFKKLNEALEFIKTLSSQGKKILFVSTKPQTQILIPEVAKETGNPYVTEKWFGGLLTNFKTIKERIKYMQKLKEERDSGEFEKYTKKEALKLGKKIIALEKALGGVEEMTKAPDAVFVVDCRRDNIAIREARKLKIPVIAIADSNANPEELDYFIPGNDDAMKSLGYLLGLIKEAIFEGKKNAQKVSEPQRRIVKIDKPVQKPAAKKNEEKPEKKVATNSK